MTGRDAGGDGEHAPPGGLQREKTVSVHISHILAKLGVTNRTEAAAAARRISITP